MFGTTRKKKKGSRTRSRSAAPAVSAGRRILVPLTLFEAVTRGTMEDVQRLHESGLGMAARDDDGRTALHCAAAAGRPDMISFMLDLRAVPVDSRDNRGMTPLYHAVMRQSQRCVRLLLDAGASPNAPAASGITPMLWAANKAPALHTIMQEYVQNSSPAARAAAKLAEEQASREEKKYRDSAVKWGSRTLYLGDSFCGGGMLVNRQRKQKDALQEDVEEGTPQRAAVGAPHKGPRATPIGLSISPAVPRAHHPRSRAATASSPDVSVPPLAHSSPAISGSLSTSPPSPSAAAAAASSSSSSSPLSQRMYSPGTIRAALSPAAVGGSPLARSAHAGTTSSASARHATRASPLSLSVRGAVSPRASTSLAYSDQSGAASSQSARSTAASSPRSPRSPLPEGATLSEYVCTAGELMVELSLASVVNPIELESATDSLRDLLQTLRPLLAQLPFELRALVPLLHERMQALVGAARPLQSAQSDVVVASYRHQVALLAVSLWQLHLAVGHLDRRNSGQSGAQSSTPMLDMLPELLRKVVPTADDNLDSVKPLHSVVRCRLVHGSRELLSQVAPWKSGTEQAALAHQLATIHKGTSALLRSADHYLGQDVGAQREAMLQSLTSLSAALRKEVRDVCAALRESHIIASPLQEVAAMAPSAFLHLSAPQRTDAPTADQAAQNVERCLDPFKLVMQLAEAHPSPQHEAIGNLADMLNKKTAAVTAHLTHGAAFDPRSLLAAVLDLTNTSYRLATLSVHGRSAMLFRDCASALNHYRSGLLLQLVNYSLGVPSVTLQAITLYVQNMSRTSADLLLAMSRDTLAA